MQSRHSTQVIDFSLTFHVYLLLTQKKCEKIYIFELFEYLNYRNYSIKRRTSNIGANPVVRKKDIISAQPRVVNYNVCIHLT